MAPFGNRLKHAWNAFLGRDGPKERFTDVGPGYSRRPDRLRLGYGHEKSIINAIETRIAIDVSAIEIRHVRLDDQGRYKEDIKSPLNECLRLSANKDQTAAAFFRDAVMTMLEEGTVAIVPVDTDVDPVSSNAYEIFSLRCGRITEWFPDYVRINLYNDRSGEKEEITLPKKSVAIVENPFYSVMNEPNSTLQRLLRKLALLDSVDEQTSSGKLDLIIQLPYVIKTEARRREAEKRRSEIVEQLTGSQYGIAYTDGTEHITQLNRPLENNLLKQIEYLSDTLYAQLGLTPEIMNGTADEKTMLNYMNRTILPIVSGFTMEMIRKFLSKTARTQGQWILFFNDPFKLMPVSNIADIADKFTRNEIMTSNEIRGKVGMKPSEDPKADQLINSNLNQSKEAEQKLLESPNEEAEEPEMDPAKLLPEKSLAHNGDFELNAVVEKLNHMLQTETEPTAQSPPKS